MITEYSKCKCGAYTLYFENGANNSMKHKTLKRLGIPLKGIKKLPETYACNHCVNRWGVDLCECGSGKEVGKCDCGSQNSLQNFGEVYDSFGKLLKVWMR